MKPNREARKQLWAFLRLDKITGDAGSIPVVYSKQFPLSSVGSFLLEAWRTVNPCITGSSPVEGAK